MLDARERKNMIEFVRKMAGEESLSTFAYLTDQELEHVYEKAYNKLYSSIEE